MMQNFISKAYLVECQTNLHVGSGDNNYGVIDKQVQRDVISAAPVIHASSLKGAFREYFENCVYQGTGPDKEKVAALFGSDKNEKNHLKQGSLRFFEASLLSVPVRGTGAEPYYRATSTEIMNTFNNTAQDLGLDIQITLPANDNTDAITEFGDHTLLSHLPYLGDKVIKMPQAILEEEVFSRLPILARNSLENGQSDNLWYEEVVPRESRFYFFIAYLPDENNSFDFERDFNNHVHNRIIQIGANGTVGYGYCKIINMKQL